MNWLCHQIRSHNKSIQGVLIGHDSTGFDSRSQLLRYVIHFLGLILISDDNCWDMCEVQSGHWCWQWQGGMVNGDDDDGEADGAKRVWRTWGVKRGHRSCPTRGGQGWLFWSRVVFFSTAFFHPMFFVLTLFAFLAFSFLVGANGGVGNDYWPHLSFVLVMKLNKIWPGWWQL